MQQFDLLFVGVFFFRVLFLVQYACASFNVFCDVFNLRPLILLTVIGSFFFMKNLEFLAVRILQPENLDS